MPATALVVENVIRKLITRNEDYRTEVIALLDTRFLNYVVEFFTRIFQAKLKNEKITPDWYKKELLDVSLPPEELAIHSGLNKKTIRNVYRKGTREIIIDASLKHYDTLRKVIEELTEQEEVDITLTIKFNHGSVELNISESLIVINTLAVKRAALRGGVWSTAGKQAEKPLMITLCRLFRVPPKYYDQTNRPKSRRETDFYLKDGNLDFQPCEVKLMGKGNPESLKSALVRIREAKDDGKSFIFVADTLSDENREDLIDSGALWVELNVESGYRNFARVLKALKIPHKPPAGNLSKAVDRILAELSDEAVERMATEAAKKVEASSNEAAE